ncbi:olfactory receptor 6N2-like [Archocentrus centrarchus]|uniref:olfactory receptor 6N2-like n=1 Tax=Archocentrus centrarchus TaxID=63155 RepID=UPI0011E9B813|nr:olfactory receptor 6N2-like [Archocentrus centrarchus]
MELELNVTYITLDGFVQVYKYRYLYFVIMFTVYILILCCNSTIVFLIVVKKSLHEPMYIFIAALLLNSVMLSTVIYPKLLIDFLSERPIMSYSACLFQFSLYYSLGGSEFLLLLAMAYDRYVSICKPLQYPVIMRQTTINILLALAWIVPSSQVAVIALLMSPEKICSFTFDGLFCTNTIYKLLCEQLESIIVHDIVVLFNVAILPVAFIFFTYARILVISYRSCREVRRKAAQTCLPHLIVLISYSCLCACDVISGLESNVPKTVHLIMTLQIVTYNPLFNPIIYGLKMKEISKHLKRLFCAVKMN